MGELERKTLVCSTNQVPVVGTLGSCGQTQSLMGSRMAVSHCPTPTGKSAKQALTEQPCCSTNFTSVCLVVIELLESIYLNNLLFQGGFDYIL